MDEGQVDFIQTLKRSTISVASAIYNYTPSGGIGCIPLNVSMYYNGWKIWQRILFAWSLVPLTSYLVHFRFKEIFILRLSNLNFSKN